MFTTPPPFVDWILGLSLPKLALLVLGAWAGIAVLVHKVLVPWAGGPGGRRLGRFEAEVASQLGLVFGLLLSFNAVTVWEQYGKARDAVLAEASALREIADLSSELAVERRRELNLQLQAYLRYLIQTEWPKLGVGALTLDKPSSLRALAGLVRAGSSDELHAALGTAIEARDGRIRIATNRMLPARWTLVIVLGALTVLAVGLVHAEHPRARAMALAMVSFGIACCLLVLLVYTRPFLGALALQPAELVLLAGQLAAP